MRIATGKSKVIGAGRLWTCYFLLFSMPLVVFSQDKPVDTSHYVSYAHRVTLRTYFSRKFTNLELEKPKSISRFSYRPNSTLNFGVGASYRSLTVNLGYGFEFLNPDRGRGKTKYLDLQSHIYGRYWVVDLFAQFYKGYYLWPKGLNAESKDSYYKRPDIKINMLGINAYRLLNGDKFSYRAALIQNEWQKKSAGSFLYGGEVYIGVVTGDSALVPAALSASYSPKNVRSLRFVELGPGVGYAYTLVLQRHFFLTGSLTGSLNLGFVKEITENYKTDKVTLTPNYLYRVVGGYNTYDWTVSLSLIRSDVHIRGASSPDKYFVSIGNYRLTFAKRFYPGPKLKKKLKPIATGFKKESALPVD